MKYETYIKNKAIFLGRYKENEFGYDYIEKLLAGIHNKNLFFKILTMDILHKLFMAVRSVERYKRFSNWNNSAVGSRIKIMSRHSRYEKYPELFNKDLKLIK